MLVFSGLLDVLQGGVELADHRLGDGVAGLLDEAFQSHTRHHFLLVGVVVGLLCHVAAEGNHALHHFSEDRGSQRILRQRAHRVLDGVAIGPVVLFVEPVNCVLPKQSSPEIRPLEPEEITRFIQNLEGEPYKNLFLTAFFTGMRQGELLRLSWDHVDFESGIIEIRQQLQCLDGTNFLETPKHDKVRIIAPPQLVMDALWQGNQQQAENRRQMGNTWQNKWNLVFTDGFGKHLVRRTVDKHYKKILVEGEPSKIKKFGSTNGYQSGDVYETDGLSPTLCGMDMVKSIVKIKEDKKPLKIKANNKKGYDEVIDGDGVRLCHPSSTTARGRTHKGQIGALSTSTDWGTVDANFRIRRLTPLECERLQAFPDNWTKYGNDGKLISDTQRYKCLGNAVTTTVVTYIANTMFGEDFES